MVVDTSAIIAIMREEPGWERLLGAIRLSSTRLVSAPTVVEATLVLLGLYGERGEVNLDPFLRSIDATIVDVDARQLAIARDAARVFGRGRHKAALNFGDSFSYALALSADQPLLFVGDDFAATDVAIVEW